MQSACLFAGASAGRTFVGECSDRIPVIAKLKGTLCFLCCQVRTYLLQILHLASSIIMTKFGTLLRIVAKPYGFACCLCMMTVVLIGEAYSISCMLLYLPSATSLVVRMPAACFFAVVSASKILGM